MKKKLLIILCIVLIAIGCAACSGDRKSENNPTESSKDKKVQSESEKSASDSNTDGQITITISIDNQTEGTIKGFNFSIIKNDTVLINDRMTPTGNAFTADIVLSDSNDISIAFQVVMPNDSQASLGSIQTISPKNGQTYNYTATGNMRDGYILN